MNENNAAQAVQEAERIAAADEYFQARTWIMDTNDNRRIFEAGFDRAYALLSKLRVPVSSIREGFELTYAADAGDPACAADLSHFTNGWRACLMSQVRAPVADERAQDVDLPWLRAYMHHQIASDRWVVTADQARDFARAAVLADRQARDALASAPVADERQAVAYLDLGTGGYVDVGTDLTDKQLAALPKGRHMLAIIGTHGVDGYTTAALASAPVQWPTMPPSKGQSPVLFEDGYAEGWAKCMDECRRAVSQASAPVADERGLLPCPFCGSEAFETFKTDDDGIRRHSVHCKDPNCGGQTRDRHFSEAKAIAAWNRRAALASAPVAGEVPTDADLDKLYRETVTEGPDHDTRCWENPHRLYARAVLSRYAAPHASTVAGEADKDEHAQLRIFYGVQTDSELIAAQERHVARLQAKLPSGDLPAHQRVREG